jgi:hypothetical protein
MLWDRTEIRTLQAIRDTLGMNEYEFDELLSATMPDDIKLLITLKS